MARRFWEEDDGIYGGHLVYEPYHPGAKERNRFSRGPIPQFSYPSNDYLSDKGVLLGFYGPGRIAGLNGKPLSDATVQERIDYVLKHASVVHPQIRKEYESAYAVWWPKIRYSEGAWASFPGGRKKQLTTPDGRLFVGSAGTSSDPAWQEGAVEAAWTVVKNVHSTVKRT